MSSYRENMKFEYNIDLIRRIVKFSEVGRSGKGPKKCHFALNGISKNELLICEVCKIISEMDS